jgi:hypothetical protein
MNLTFPTRSQIEGLPGGTFISQAITSIIGTIGASWSQEHNADNTHSTIHATGDVLAAGVGTFTGQPRAFVAASAVTLATGVETVLSWDTPAIDGAAVFAPDSGWNVGGIFDPAAPTLLLAPQAGLYLVSYALRFAGNSTGKRYAFLSTTRYGASADLAQNLQGAHASGNMVAESIVIPFMQGQGIFLSAFQDSGGTLALTTGFLNSWIQMTKIA